MIRIAAVSALAFALAAAAPTVAAACEGKAKPQTASLQTVTVQDLSKMQSSEKLAIFDVNTEQTRSKYGVIPSARLLTSASQFEAAELPAAKDTSLVFYCANTQCSASKTAANRALEVGYTSVFVLPVGIKGWVEAGQPTDRPQS